MERREVTPHLEGDEGLTAGVFIFQWERLNRAYKINGNDSTGAKVEPGGDKRGNC